MCVHVSICVLFPDYLVFICNTLLLLWSKGSLFWGVSDTFQSLDISDASDSTFFKYFLYFPGLFFFFLINLHFHLCSNWHTGVLIKKAPKISTIDFLVCVLTTLACTLHNFTALDEDRSSSCAFGNGHGFFLGLCFLLSTCFICHIFIQLNDVNSGN